MLDCRNSLIQPYNSLIEPGNVIPQFRPEGSKIFLRSHVLDDVTEHLSKHVESRFFSAHV